MTIGSNLSLRITAILLGGFVLLQMLIWVVMALPSRGDDQRPYNLPLPTEARTMVDTLEAAPPARRASLVTMFNGSLYTVQILREPPPAPATQREGLDRLRLDYAAALPGRDIGLTGRRPLLGRMAGTRPWTSRFFAPITLTVPMRGGDLLVVDSRPSMVVRAYLRQRAFLGAVGGLLVLGVLALAVRQTTRPLVRLSAGVRRFTSDLDTPDLPVAGSREMRDLSAAFNEMKARIGGLMAERTRMLAGIAHDMRTYLTRLRLRAEFIDDSEQRAKAAADLDEMAALLDDTLLLAKRDGRATPQPQRIDLATELAAIVALRVDMGDAVTLGAIPPDLAIEATPISLRRMLANLIDNGVRHGGHVSIEASADDQTVTISVADDGPGVPPETLQRLGEPFGRLDPSRNRETGGAGLGLAIVRALADREGATIRFANQPKGGFVATATFPRDNPNISRSTRSSKVRAG
ncbi:ATP-binding protein [Edaphosphingomonas haloaromaticamans]|uniref:histidine kinase n=1 Tax=Edaphosphingomonas haloaromaticamans TaxID=653954 RepID=A0A1S1HJU1_9SPHN|nr:ATP-binding protein [Sphingomonas haloaromaticamans]OHT21721.1 Osmolarity sensor protein EnvZ [Sphingomonas haloaromaticamans]